MVFYSNVPLAEENKCPSHLDHNRLARQFNLRLTRSGPDCAWRIFYYADSIFLGMRNTATPGVPLGVSPAEDEWWKVYMNIEYPTGTTGTGNWPMTLAGTPQGANVMNPLNAFIFGRKTAENKLIEKFGPWAEGNSFDGIVESSRAVLSNKQYWESAFRQRGAMALNPSRNEYSKAHFQGYDYIGRKIKAKYFPTPYDPIFVSTGLFSTGRSADKYFTEYASNTVYMRYPPSIKHGVYVKYGEAYAAPDGVLKRKNAAKDLLNWGLWVYTYYFRGAEQQRSLFCDGGGEAPFNRPWNSTVISVDATREFAGQYTPFIDKSDHYGPLDVCRVGFNFYKYFTRQNVFAPVLGSHRKTSVGWALNPQKFYKELDEIGNPRVEQYRVTYKYDIPIVLPDDKNAEASRFCHGPIDSLNKASLENYDNHESGGGIEGEKGFYGKTIRFKKEDMSETTWNDSFLMKCSYESLDLSNKDKDSFSYRGLTSSSSPRLTGCLAGYYLETTAVENAGMKFKLRIWGGNKIVHETIIKHKYSYAVNRNPNKKRYGRRAYIFNKIYYFKEGLDYSRMRFEIVPSETDTNPRRNMGKHKGSGIISFGNAFSSVIDTSYEAATEESYKDVTTANLASGKKWYIYPNKQELDENGKVIGGYQSHLVHEAAAPYLKTGDMVKIKYQYLKPLKEGPYSSYLGLERAGGPVSLSNDTTETGYVLSGRVLFVRKVEDVFYEEGDEIPEGKEAGDAIEGEAKLFFYERQDDRLYKKEGTDIVGPVVDVFHNLDPMPNSEYVAPGHVDEKNKPIQASRVVTIEKMLPSTELFKATLDLAILVKTKPTFHDLYALFRATTDKQNRRNTSSNIILGDGKGVGTVGHHFTESNRVWRNYYKYGSAMNVYGSSVVPALRMYVSANPIYESMRKFISSYMRFADRRELINYTEEGGRGVFYFKRYCWGLPKKAKATVLRNMEPSIEPAGWFDKGVDAVDTDSHGHAKFVPIKKNKLYRVVCNNKTGSRIVYNKLPLSNGTIFKGGDKEYIDSHYGIDPRYEGAFEIEGISRGTNYETNEWIMFMTSSHYHWANTNIYKPDVYNDIMGFLNNRCHHRSKEYERRTGNQYDMIRTELCRVMSGPRGEPGPRLHIFLSKSSNNFNFVFNTNNPHEGNLGLYAEHSIPPYDYFRSCSPTTPRPYKVISTQVVSSRANGSMNLSCLKINDVPPSEIVRVELDRPLRGTGRLSVGRSGWRSINRAALQKEPYRTDENAVIEYLHHLAGNYSCKRNMIGDYGAESDVVEGGGYRPFGACYPRFYFLKLIPKVKAGALLSTDPYAQMDFYLRAMGGAFINPYATPVYRQTSALNWQFGELASRSVEEDPTLYNYIDPRNVQS